MNLNSLDSHLPSTRQPLAPALFLGHGSPMNILHDNAFTRSLHALGASLPPPTAALVVSAHWLTRGDSRVAVSPHPTTIHDFGGFPAELYQLTYPAPGSPEMAQRVVSQVQSIRIHEDHEMGLDHGAWSVLRHLWPSASVPVFQLSIDYSKAPDFHYKLGQELRSLRERGLMLIGSGNIVHNLRRLDWHDEQAAPFDWAREFDTWVKDRLSAGDHQALIAYESQGASARAAVPTNDHYLPMLYTLGALAKNEAVRFTHESFQHGSISMRCFESIPG